MKLYVVEVARKGKEGRWFAWDSCGLSECYFNAHRDRRVAEYEAERWRAWGNSACVITLKEVDE